MIYLVYPICIAINVAFYLYGLSLGANYWWNLLVTGFILGMWTALIIHGRS